MLWQRFDLASNKAFYFCCLGFLVLTILFIQGLRRARAGRVLLATRDNEKAAAAMSVPPVRTKLAGFVLAGAIAGVAGGLYAVLLGAVGLRHLRPLLRAGGVLHGRHRRPGLHQRRAHGGRR